MSKNDKTCWVLVETISVFRDRFLVECPVEHPEYALDSVVMGEAKVFSSEDIGSNVVSHRVVSEEEALAICDKDNDYSSEWDNDTKKKNFFTREEEIK